jgi:hypothetical protein
MSANLELFVQLLHQQKTLLDLLPASRQIPSLNSNQRKQRLLELDSLFLLELALLPKQARLEAGERKIDQLLMLLL